MSYFFKYYLKNAFTRYLSFAAIPIMGMLTPLMAAPDGSIDMAFVQKVENYLNGIKSYRATISQLNNDGATQSGHVYMLRDGVKSYGKMRIEYDPPVKDLIVVDGQDFIFYDSHTKEKNVYDVDATPAAFLLRRHVDLRQDLKVIRQRTHEDGTVHLTVVRPGEESAASLTLQFATKPMLKLNGWAVTDPQGLTTQVQLKDVNIGINLDPSLFSMSSKG